MYKNKRIAVVIRAYNEEKSVMSVVDSIPNFVDRIYIINDASTDGTLKIISYLSKQDSRIVVVGHEVRMGPGSAAISGLKKALQDDIDITAIIDGDGQMIPSILSHFIDPLVSNKADYAKGNRLSQLEHKREMPHLRLFGNLLLTYLTRIASGYWHISDPQNGYTAISKETLKKIDLNKIEKGFAFENDMLVKLNVIRAKVIDIPHQAVYRGESSKIRYHSFIIKTSFLLIKDFVWRINVKYLRINSCF